jgi:D-glycero-D-manno-heptose 1,7-bisphosphate phosphatase
MVPISCGLRKAIFLDRDGVINVRRSEVTYVSGRSLFTLLPGVPEALGILGDLGFLLVVVTNQRGIARGVMTEEDLADVHAYLEEQLADCGVRLDGIFHCPHEEFENCGCRKPDPGMILSAIQEIGIDPAHSYMVGDSPSDIEAGHRAGTRTVRIAAEPDEIADFTFASLLEFATFLRDGTRNQSG